MKKRPVLFLLFAAIVTVMCRCEATPDVHRTFDQTQGDPVSCVMVDYVLEFGDVTGWELTCSMPCPNGGTELFKWHGAHVPSVFKTEDYCAGVKSVPTPTLTVAPPTATATSTATPAPAALLSGEVSACSMKDGFINFKLAAISPLVNEKDIILTINGTQVPCTFAGNDNSLLSCPLPPGSTFPAQIHVAQGNATVNDFSYDGSGCSNAAPGGSGGDGSPATPDLGD